MENSGLTKISKRWIRVQWGLGYFIKRSLPKDLISQSELQIQVRFFMGTILKSSDRDETNHHQTKIRSNFNVTTGAEGTADHSKLLLLFLPSPEDLLRTS